MPIKGLIVFCDFSLVVVPQSIEFAGSWGPCEQMAGSKASTYPRS